MGLGVLRFGLHLLQLFRGGLLTARPVRAAFAPVGCYCPPYGAPHRCPLVIAPGSPPFEELLLLPERVLERISVFLSDVIMEEFFLALGAVATATWGLMFRVGAGVGGWRRRSGGKEVEASGGKRGGGEGEGEGEDERLRRGAAVVGSRHYGTGGGPGWGGERREGSGRG